jgi:hypothetical protein
MFREKRKEKREKRKEKREKRKEKREKRKEKRETSAMRVGQLGDRNIARNRRSH